MVLRDLLDGVRVAVADGLAAEGRPVGGTVLAVAGVSVADCCDGVVSVVAERVYRVGSVVGVEFDGEVDRCVWGVGVDVLVQVDRCVPVINGRQVPSLAEQEDGNVKVLEDAMTVWHLMTDGRFADAVGVDEDDVRVVGQVFGGPEGGCVNVQSRFALRVPRGAWC